MWPQPTVRHPAGRPKWPADSDVPGRSDRRLSARPEQAIAGRRAAQKHAPAFTPISGYGRRYKWSESQGRGLAHNCALRAAHSDLQDFD